MAEPKHVIRVQSGRLPSRASLRRLPRAACDRRSSRARPSRRAAACDRRSAPDAPCPLRPCTRCMAGRYARTRRRWHAVLARAGFGDDALGADAFGEQRLADGVVDLVRAGVREILALQTHLRAPALGDLGTWVSAVGRPTHVFSSCVNCRLEVRGCADARACRPRAARTPG